MQSTKSADFIGHSKFLPWQQLNGCSVTRHFLSEKGVACKTRFKPWSSEWRSDAFTSWATGAEDSFHRQFRWLIGKSMWLAFRKPKFWVHEFVLDLSVLILLTRHKMFFKIYTYNLAITLFLANFLSVIYGIPCRPYCVIQLKCHMTLDVSTCIALLFH